ncbi:conserved Plasmodium protein, unknown function [Plasmodium sp. gorilla clade G1]|nr:conserved Plasmodium protein, unknown function [Plasmodium sp. gorilla clade G1]
MSKKYYEKLLSDIQNQSKPVESKFGSYILQKFGWEKGKGLGKHENGDVKIIKIKKYGEHGLGYNEHEENNNGMWWENMYNNCAKKINTDNNKNTTNSSTSNNNSKEKIVKNNQNIKYSLFVKKDTCIISSACTSLEQQQQAEDEKINKTQDVKIKNKHINKNENNINNIKLITNKSSEQNHDAYVKRSKKKKKKKKKKKHKHKHKSEDKSDDDKTVD